MGIVETFSTAGLIQADRLPYWNDVALSTIGPLVVDAVDRDRFVASMTRIILQNCEIVSPVSDAARIHSLAGGDSAGVLNLTVQHRGSSSTMTGSLSGSLDAGDFMIYDPALPFELNFSESTQMIVIRLPLADAEGRLPGLRRLAGLSMSGRRGAGAVLSGFIRNAWSQLDADDLGWADSLCEVLWPLVEMAFLGVRATQPDRTPRAQRRHALFAFVEHHLCEPELSARSIAGELGLSTRYVQIAFAEIGTTPSAYIQSRRLDRAAREFARRGPAASITQTALDAGFNDLSGFSRVFRRRFGVAPRAYRAGARAPAA